MNTFGGFTGFLGKIVYEKKYRIQIITNLDYLNEFQKILLKLSTEFINLPTETYDIAIERALRLIGEYVGVEHCYIGLFTENSKQVTIKHEWTIVEGHSIEDTFPTELSPWFEAQIKNKQVVPVQYLDSLPLEAEAYRQNLIKFGVLSVIDVPLIVKDKVIGFIGYESTSCEYVWTDDLIQLLKFVGEIYVNVHERQQQELIRQHHMAFQQLILDLTTRYIDNSETALQTTIVDTLEIIGKFVGADRSFVAYTPPNLENMPIVYEWCETNISSALDYREHILKEEYPRVLEQFQIQDVVHLSLSYIPSSAKRLQDAFHAIGIQSTIAISMIYQGKWLGFLGFDSVITERLWSLADITLLKVVSQIIINALQNQAIVENIIDREKLQTALAKEKEIVTNRNDILSTLSHEIRTPLTSMSMAVDLLRHKLGNESTNNEAKHLDRIQSQVFRLDSMLDSLSIAIQSEGGYLKFNPKPIDLTIFCQKLMDRLQIMVLQTQSLLFEHNTARNIFTGDVVLLDHILMNLLTNAIKYSPDGGNITLEIQHTATDTIFAIQDEGLGISEDDQQKLFKPYFRANNVGKIRGTGLGLKIVKDCVDLHGGVITVDSELGKGTTFTIIFPH